MRRNRFPDGFAVHIMTPAVAMAELVARAALHDPATSQRLQGLLNRLLIAIRRQQRRIDGIAQERPQLERLAIHLQPIEMRVNQLLNTARRRPTGLFIRGIQPTQPLQEQRAAGTQVHERLAGGILCRTMPLQQPHRRLSIQRLQHQRLRIGRQFELTHRAARIDHHQQGLIRLPLRQSANPFEGGVVGPLGIIHNHKARHVAD